MAILMMHVLKDFSYGTVMGFDLICSRMGLSLFRLMQVHDLDCETQAGQRDTSCQEMVRLCYLSRGGC